MNRLGLAIKKYFTPTEHNEMLPLGLGRDAFFLYFLLALVLILSPVYLRISELATLAGPDILDSQAQILVRLTNQSRIAVGLPELKENPKLVRAAGLKVDDMFAQQYFAHFSPVDNTSPWDFFRAADYRYYAAGENLAVDFVTAEAAHTALMQSPTHRANIMSPLFTEIGISAKQGVWQNHSSVMIAQYFGRERVTAATVAYVAPSAPTPVPVAPTHVAPSPAAPIAAQPTPAPVQVLGTDSEATTPVIPSPSEQLEAPALINKLPAPELPAVTPAPLPSSIPLTSFGDKLGQIFTAQNEIKMLSLFVILSILVSFMFLLTRGERLTVPVAARVLVLIVMFGYIAVFGVGEFSMSAVPSTPAASIVIGG